MAQVTPKPLRKSDLQRMERKLDEVIYLLETERTTCSRCGMTWGEHRASDNACPSHDEQGAVRIYHNNQIFKPLYS